MIAITLDNKHFTTRSGHKVTVPTQALADVILTELQQDKAMHLREAPMARLAYSACDAGDEDIARWQAELLRYFATDTLCYRMPEGDPISAEQIRSWNPVVDWAKMRYDCAIFTTHAIAPIQQPTETQQRITQCVQSFSPYELVGVLRLSESFDSLLLALAVFENHMSVDQGFELSQLESTLQEVKWGADSESSAKRAAKLEDARETLKWLQLLRD